MKKIIHTLSLLIFSYATIVSQSHLWSLPGQRLDMTDFNPITMSSPLPIPTVDPWGNPNNFGFPFAYDGRTAEYSHNAMHDENGDLLFFIVDGYVFDKDGYLIDEISYDNSNIEGHSEYTIVPVPDHCNQYYLISAGKGFGGDYDVVYTKLDLEATSTHWECELLGALVPIDGFPTYQLVHKLNTMPEWVSGWIGGVADNIFFAATKLRSDNTRFLFASSNDAIFRFKITSTGITYDNYFLLFSSNGASIPSGIMAEMEIVELPNGDYRLACPFKEEYTLSGNPVINQALYTVDLYGSGINLGEGIPNTGLIFTYPTENNSLHQARITGLEFSENGDYLYIMHVMSDAHPIPLQVFDYQSQVLTPLNYTGIEDFELSHIELGFNGSMYVVNDGALGQITNPNTPFASNNFLPSFLSVNYDIGNQTGISYGSKTYTLPDQIDGQDYLESFNQSCCSKIDGFTCNYTADPSSQNWSGNGANPFGAISEVRIYDELRIPAGANITIHNMTFRFADGARMIIEKGARVTLYGTTLTSFNCDVMWQGVSVTGDPNQPQIPYSNQGHLRMYNESEISNARIGVSLHERNSSEVALWSKIGGLIYASNSTFKNNKKDVEFLSYNYRNRSSFSNCTFITDAQLNDGSICGEHVSLFNVYGVYFRGCTFKNATTQGQFYNDTQRGTGIRSINASYKVNYGCDVTLPYWQSCPDANKLPNIFEGLFYGINADGTGSANSIEVKHNVFNNNTRAAFFGAVDYAVFVNNDIDLAEEASWGSYGLYFYNSTGYKIENNEFDNIYAGTAYGLIIYNSNSNGLTADENEVYNNKFTGLLYGAAAFGENVQLSGVNPVNNTGLTFKCNKFSGSQIFDIGVMFGGIKPFQGVCVDDKSPANNEFSSVIPSTGDFWNYNSTTYQLSYRYSDGNGTYQTEPRMISEVGSAANTSKYMCGLVYDPVTSCPVNRFDVSGKKMLKVKMLGLKQQAAIEEQYLATVDGAFQDAWDKVSIGAYNWGQFKNALLNVSPYLTEKDLKLLLENSGTIPGGILKQILMANSPLSTDVVNLLDNSQLSGGVKQQVNSIQNFGVNGRIEKEQEIAYYQHEAGLVFNEIIREFIHDTIIDGTDSAIVMLKERNYSVDECRLVSFYIKNKNYVKAQEQLDYLRLKDPVKYEEYCKLNELIMHFEQTINNCYSIKTDIVRKTKLETIANVDISMKSCYRAQVLLNEVYKFGYEEPEPDFLQQKNSVWVEEREKHFESEFTIYPNPAKDILTIELLLETEEIALVRIYDAIGKEISIQSISNTESYVDVSEIDNGSYIIAITLPDGSMLTEKLIIRK